MKEIVLRDYQKECIEKINSMEKGRYLVSLATGLGKTVIFSHIERKGRVLLLSHRDELVHQPQKYYDCSFGVEQAKERSHGEEVVSASVMSLKNRLDKFDPDEFDTIITDEAHHAAAATYKKIYAYFRPRLHLGFTATPNRGDKVRLDDVYDDIIFQRDLKWGIDNGYLTDIDCMQVFIDYDLTKVKISRKKSDGSGERDFDIKALEERVNVDKHNMAVAKAYKDFAIGQTIIFTLTVDHAMNVAKYIEGAVVVSAMTPKEERAEIIRKFTNREIPCLVNCMVFTEGVDMPLIETVIIARPTMNQSLYTQMVGRGLRLSEGKKALRLIDCVGVTDTLEICTAPSLLGIDTKGVPQSERSKVRGLLTQMDGLIKTLTDIPDNWIVNAKKISLFNENGGFDTLDINWNKNYKGNYIVSLPNGDAIVLKAMDKLGKTQLFHVNFYKRKIYTKSQPLDMQSGFYKAKALLQEQYSDCKQLWDLNIVKYWGDKSASDAQKKFIRTLMKKKENADRYNLSSFNINFDNLTKYEANVIIEHLK